MQQTLRQCQNDSDTITLNVTSAIADNHGGRDLKCKSTSLNPLKHNRRELMIVIMVFLCLLFNLTTTQVRCCDACLYCYKLTSLLWMHEIALQFFWNVNTCDFNKLSLFLYFLYWSYIHLAGWYICTCISQAQASAQTTTVHPVSFNFHVQKQRFGNWPTEIIPWQHSRNLQQIQICMGWWWCGHDDNEAPIHILDDSSCMERIVEAFPQLLSHFLNETYGAFKADICRLAFLYSMEATILILM